jgi:hypothetical protein
VEWQDELQIVAYCIYTTQVMSLTNSSLNSSIDVPLKASSPPPHLCAMPLIQTPPFWKNLFLVTLARRAYNKLPPLQLLKDALFTLCAMRDVYSSNLGLFGIPESCNVSLLLHV